MRYGIERSGVVLATIASLVLILSACTQLTSQQPTNSPDATPSTPAVSTTPSTAPTPADSPTPSTAPAPIPSPSPARLIITTVNFHMGEVGLTYGTVTAGAAGGVKPYKWSISSGALPSGLALSQGGSTTGKPAAAGTYSFVIRVDDAAGAAAGVSRSIFVFRQIAFAKSTAICTGSYNGGGGGCTTTLAYSGGASSTAPKVNVTVDPQSPALPPGSSFIAKSGVVTVTITTPGCPTSYDSVVTIVLVDQSPCGAGFNCSSGKLILTIRMTSGC